MSRSRPRVLTLAATALAALTLAAGCSTPAADSEVVTDEGQVFDLSAAQSDRVRVDRVDDIAALVPQAIRDRGTLVVTGSGGTAPPLRFYADDDRTVIGSEVDLTYLVSDILGLTPDLRVADWSQNFVSVDSGESDLFVSNVTVTEERKDKYDFATYRLDNVSFETTKGSGWTVETRQDIAGKKIGVSSGTNQEQLLVEWNEQNVADGLAPAEIAYYQNASDYYLALGSGRIDGYLGPNPSAVYHAATSGDTEVVGSVSGAGDALQGEIGVLTKKGNGLIEAVQRALEHAIEDGSYQRVLDRWGLGGEAVDVSEINPPGLPRKAP